MSLLCYSCSEWASGRNIQTARSCSVINRLGYPSLDIYYQMIITPSRGRTKNPLFVTLLFFAQPAGTRLLKGCLQRCLLIGQFPLQLHSWVGSVPVLNEVHQPPDYCFIAVSATLSRLLEKELWFVLSASCPVHLQCWLSSWLARWNCSSNII